MTDAADEQPRFYPAWRHALHELELASISPGQTIQKVWLEELFGLQVPQTIAEAEKQRLTFLGLFDQLRWALLEKHRLMLRPVPGVGYRVVEPEQQTSVAMKDRGAELMRALGKMAAEISHVRLEALDDTQRKANADAQAKVGALVGMSRKQLGHG